MIEDKNKRFLAYSFNTIKDLLESGDVEKAKNVFINSSEALIKEGDVINSKSITKDISRYDTYLKKLENIDDFYVSTGFKELDKIIGGWDRQDELATIVARPGTSKTWCLLKSAVESAKQGLKVGIYSGEMSEDLVGYRIDTLISHISNGALTHGSSSVKSEYEDYINNISKYVKGEIKIITPKLINGPAGVNALRSFINKDKLDILFVDQHSLLEDDRNARNPVERASNISRDLKNLQVMEKIPIISVSQQNRTKTEDKSVDTSQISQADRIGQDSTVVIFLSKEDNLLKLHLVKSRNSVNGKILNYHIDLNKGEFQYIPTEDDEKELVEESTNKNLGEDVF